MTPPADLALESTLTSKGKATIPRSIRESLKLKPGARIRFFMHPNGYVAILPTTPASALKGIVRPRRDTTVSLKEMAEASPESLTILNGKDYPDQRRSCTIAVFTRLR